MYETYWNLSEKPFPQRRSTGRLYRSQTQHLAALRLKYCVDNASGAGLLLGPAGSGKTSLLKSLAADSGGAYYFVHMIFPLLRPAELLRQLAADLSDETAGMISDRTGDDQVLGQIRQSVKTHCGSGRLPVICLDDAHQLSDDAIQHVVQPLLNLADSDDKLRLSVILAGQPILSAGLRRHAQVNDRVAVVATLQGFTPAEVADYIETAVRAAGGRRGLFTQSAVEYLCEITGGNPRRINRLCDMALLVGCAERLSEISAAEIEAISHELMPAAA